MNIPISVCAIWCEGCFMLCFDHSQQQHAPLTVIVNWVFGAGKIDIVCPAKFLQVRKNGTETLKAFHSAHIFLSLSLFFSPPQPRMMGCGRTVFPTSVARCCSKPSTTCWSAASWTAASFASASGLSSPTRRMRSPSTKGTLAPLVLLSSYPCCVSFGALLCTCTCAVEMGIFFCNHCPSSNVMSLVVRWWCGVVQFRLSNRHRVLNFYV